MSVAGWDTQSEFGSKKPGSGRCLPSKPSFSHVEPPKSQSQRSRDVGVVDVVAWTRKFSGRRSECITPRRCIYAIDSATCRHHFLRINGGMVSPLSSRYCWRLPWLASTRSSPCGLSCHPRYLKKRQYDGGDSDRRLGDRLHNSGMVPQHVKNLPFDCKTVGDFIC